MTPEEKEAFLQSLNRIEQLLTLLQSNPPGGEYKAILYSIPIVGIIFGWLLLFFLFFWWYRQRMAIIKAGLYQREKFDLRLYSFFLGLILTFVGIALSVTFILVLGKSLAMLGGLIPLASGLGLLCYYKWSPKK
ncbi:hypothetical protein ACE5IS_05960 [Leptospira wolffii]|uniref:Uncharacterized protein n=1 Tax=Leptospira wolffii TaxID=409998 RepID=A0A2M9ZFA0_9LEPT|nr:hypothetical protein [Leptospira wolffii]EPG64830.1 hypothetical protein LEP1GSC061_3058 [Leptospira wolffii serovar Khorat str. Khorat-H2]PJZ67083.1 hypothetical protein CH371_03130 [Leptospira wolffii]TGK62060.1 hypothetical protein EHQ32_04270 [Leptospira wolffii]TGK68662.1 hypothetical protein EHQ27_13715 [Leptospira wolffii]TGK74554.1 hypothetical protein EHQ35_09505 [Leptospira wolffii]